MLKRPYSYHGTPIVYTRRNYPYSRRVAPRNFRLFGLIIAVVLFFVVLGVWNLLSGNEEEEKGNETYGSRELGGGEDERNGYVRGGQEEVKINDVSVVRAKNRTATQQQIYQMAKAEAYEKAGDYNRVQRELEKLFYTVPNDCALYQRAKDLLKRISEQVLLKNLAFKVHTVQRGEVLSVIAKKHKVTVIDIKRANGLTSDKIIYNQKLSIPKGKWVFIVRSVLDSKRLFLYQSVDGETFLFRVFDLPENYPANRVMHSGNLQEFLDEDDWLDYKKYRIPNDIQITNDR